MRNGLAGLLTERARISPGMEAIVDIATGSRLTFASVEANANRLAAALAPVVAKGDRLAVLSAGAYCMAMASNYNTRGRAAEVLVQADQAYLVRQRETAADTFRGEQLLA